MQVRATVFRNVIIGALLIILGGVLGYQYANTGRLPLQAQQLLPQDMAQPAEYEDVSFDTFWEVWRNLEQDYLRTENLKSTDMVNGAISGMTAALGDPYTVYLPPKENQRSGEDLAGSFYGVGIELGYRDGVLAVVAPLKGTPADQAGVQAGDLILHLKDESKKLDEDTAGWTLTEAVDKIRGANGSEITLTLLRQDQSEPMQVTLKRGEIVVASVELEMVEHEGKQVAHLKLLRFGERTSTEWNQAVTQILANRQNVSGIVLDMRNNPGGFFDGAIDIASEFIEDGVVVSQQGKFTKEDYQAKGRARLAGIPVDVLVNRGSASASEIVAGALRDQVGAKLIGEKTFGKGTVQDRRELSNGGGLHVTIAQWLLPKGDSIQDSGLPVAVEVKDDPNTPEDEAFQRALEEL